MDVELWSALHDGEIVAAEGQVPGDVTLTVKIDYIRRLFSPDGDSIVVRLLGCSRCEFRPYSASDCLVALDAIVAAQPWIVHAEKEERGLSIVCAQGTLCLAYEGRELSLDDGSAITLADLTRKAKQYWDAWAAKHQSKRRKDG